MRGLERGDEEQQQAPRKERWRSSGSRGGAQKRLPVTHLLPTIAEIHTLYSLVDRYGA